MNTWIAWPGFGMHEDMTKFIHESVQICERWNNKMIRIAKTGTTYVVICLTMMFVTSLVHLRCSNQHFNHVNTFTYLAQPYPHETTPTNRGLL